MEKNVREWELVATNIGALWRHDDNPIRPHAILTSGKHSNGYLDCSKFISDPQTLAAVGRALQDQLLLKVAPDWVFGSAFGSVLIAYELARQMSCRFGFTERPATGPLILKRFDLPRDQPVLVVELSVESDSQTDITLDLLQAHGCTVVPVVATLINRTRKQTIGGLPIVAPARELVLLWLAGIDEVNATDDLNSYPILVEQAACLVAKQLPAGVPIAWVVGSGTSSIAFAYALATQLHGKAAFTEPESGGDLALRRFTPERKERVLVCEDVLTTGGTTDATIAALETAGAEVLGHVCAIANRSGGTKLGEREIISLVQPQFSVWTPEQCPLCKQSSPAVRPKGNWALLTQP